MPMKDLYHIRILRKRFCNLSSSCKKYALWDPHYQKILFSVDSKVEFKMHLNLMFGDYKFKWYENKFITKDTYSYNLTIA